MSKIAELVWEIAEPIVQRHDCELWDVEYLKEGENWFLRVYIDRTDGVSIEHCEAVSRELDPILDERDFIPDSYTFEVSSAGTERHLSRPSDFERFIGHFIEVKLYKPRDGQKVFTGDLLSYSGGDIEINSGETVIKFTQDERASVRLRPYGLS